MKTAVVDRILRASIECLNVHEKDDDVSG